MTLTKKCSKCKKEQSLVESFCKNKTTKDGYGVWCKGCLREYRQSNKEKVNSRNRDYYRRQNEKCRATRRKNHNRRKNDPKYKLPRILRSRLHAVLKGHSKKPKTLLLLGCSVEKLREHLESQFNENMTWDNHGNKGWHVDHIRPLCTFDLTDEEELKKAFHYTNLQPLWWNENMSKPNKWEGEN